MCIRDRNYTIQVQDANGCLTDTIVNLPGAAALNLEINGDSPIQLGDSTALMALINIPLNTVDTFYWEDTTYLSCQGCYDPMSTPEQTTTFYATLIDENGCIVENEITILVEKERLIYIPSAFSPNGDGINDLLQIYGGTGVDKIHTFKIYNRWGALVFEQNDFKPNNPINGWDGKQKGDYLNPDVFAYYVLVEYTDGFMKEYKGDINLLK